MLHPPETLSNPRSSARLRLICAALGFSAGLSICSCADTPPSAPPSPPPENPPAATAAPPKDVPPSPAAAGPRAISAAVSDSSPGYKELKERMAALAARGCSHVLHPPVAVKGTVAWRPRFPDEKNGACLDLLAATGDPNKILKALVRTPSEETVWAPHPGPIMDFLYCAKEPGPHSINVISPTNENYTFAAIDCPHDVSLARLKEDKAAPPKDAEQK